MKSIVSEKGQVTIPKEVREALDLKAGQVIDFDVQKGLLIGRKRLQAAALDSVIGILKGKIDDVDGYLDEVRGPRRK